MAQVTLSVLMPHTQWGDKLFFADSMHSWDDKCELQTTKTTFPWWRCSVTFPKQDAFECKCYIVRGSEKIWESFEGNRTVVLGDEGQLAIKFNELNWKCLVCDDDLTTPPVLCTKDHPVHRECFDPYLQMELSKNNVSFSCIQCKDAIQQPVSLSVICYRTIFEPQKTWYDHVPTLTQLRFDKVQRIVNGSCVECPNALCTHAITDDKTSVVLRCPACQTTWCKFCEKQIEDDVCFICTEGLRSVFQDIYEAIEEAAGTMCPQCKSRGQKCLEECTHITCDCGAHFCYCCGVSSDHVDTADPFSSAINRLYGHNEDWESNADTRCPMWLSDFCSLYNNWPDDPYKSQKKFHEIKAQKKLTEVKKKIPEWHWERVMELDKSLNMQVVKFLQKQHELIS